VKKLLTGLEVAKAGAIAFFALGTTLFTLVGLFVSLTTSEVTFEPIAVPSVFADQGFTSEITTIRILDEVARINSASTSTKEKKNLGVKQPGDQLTTLQAMPAFQGLDLRAIQSLIQNILGVRKEKISGEITFTKDKDKVVYHVRIRMLPQNNLLVDITTHSEAPDLIKEIAVKLVEKLDPAVAASFYRWNKDIDNALRMVDEALRNAETYDDNYALVGRAQIYIVRKKFELAQQDLDRIFRSDANFVPAMTTQAYSFNEQKKYDKAMEFALRAKQYWPNRWQPHVNIGDALVGMGKLEEAEAAFISTISYNPTWWNVYDDIAKFFVQRDKRDIAEEVFLKGLLRFPENTKLLLHYGQFLLQVDRQEQATNYLMKAYRITGEDPMIWAELLKISSTKPDPALDEIRKKAQKYIKSNPDEALSQNMKKILEGI
jgi:tetratricopeptide (TPR) repeat protein